MNQLNILDSTGHASCTWDPSSPDSVAAARTAFETAWESGYLAFSMGVDGTEGIQLNEFDPIIGSILMIPPMRGG